MLTFEEAKRVGTIACLDKLGRDFVRKYRDFYEDPDDEWDEDWCGVFGGKPS